MNYIYFTFNNFFDYSIIAEQLQIKANWIFNPSESIIIFPYIDIAEYAIRHVENLCKTLNIQVTTTLEVVKDTE